MSINIGDKVPNINFTTMTAEGPSPVSYDDLFAGKRVALFSVPGAFTPTCSLQHLPGFIEKASELTAKGIDTIACMAVNDVFVMDAWGKSQDAGDKVLMLADGNGEFTSALGLDLDATGFGMGTRGQRFSLVINDGTVEVVNIEDGGEFRVSSCDYMIDQL
jgi:peroxiredoxin